MALLGYYIPSALNTPRSAAGWGLGKYHGQSFQVLYNGTVSSLSLCLSDQFGGFTDADISIYAGDANQRPTGSPLSTGSVLNSEINDATYGNPIWTDITMSSVSLTTSTWYVIVIEANGVNDFPHLLTVWGKDGTGISGKPMYSANGSTWSDYVGSGDSAFKIEGTLDGGGSPPTKATNPTPADSGTTIDFSDFTLSWDDGGDSDTYDVYIGETGNLTVVSAGQAGTTYTSDLTEIEDIFGVSPIAQKIYWRIDSSNDDGTTTGDEWNFDPRPGKASSPSPATAATDQNLTPALSWTAGTVADSYSLYVGGESQATGITDTEYSDYVDWFDYETEYTWRLDSVNDFGTTTGDNWTFTTITFDPPISTWEVLSGKTLGPLTGGTEGTDYRWLGTNNMNTVKYIVAAAKDAVHYAEI